MINRIWVVVVASMMIATVARAQSNSAIEPPKKANARAVATPAPHVAVGAGRDGTAVARDYRLAAAMAVDSRPA